jgi:acyl carrier protein
MGLDGLELVMNLEEAFGIQITDEEAINCRTPRMLIDVIFSKLKAADEHVCRSQRAFYSIRKVLVQTLGLERKSITLDWRFRDSIPKSRQREVWEQLKATLRPRNWPGLVRPAWMSLSLTVIGLAVFGGTVVSIVQLPGKAGAKDWIQPVFVATYGAGFLTLFYGIIAAVLTRPYRLYIPPYLTSIRDVIPHAVTSDHMTGWTREEVAIVVKRLTAEQLGIDESEFTEDSRFVEDLNLDG